MSAHSNKKTQTLSKIHVKILFAFKALGNFDSLFAILYAGASGGIVPVEVCSGTFGAF